MAQPTFLSGGVTPRRTDTKWTEAVRWLGVLQNQAGADPANDPVRTDSYRTILYKIARAADCDAPPPVDVDTFITEAGDPLITEGSDFLIPES